MDNNRQKEFKEIMSNAFTGDALNLLTNLLDLLGFFMAPASRKFHGAYPGGLYEHSFEVTRSLVDLTEKLSLKWERPESPYIVGMLHDLCKIDAYIINDDGTITKNENMYLKGHGDKSVVLAGYLLRALGMELTKEEIACILWHMGAYDKSENWPLLNAAIKEFPNVLWTHTADMVASQIKEC